jgi:heme-degrading monooxygenase HmoA
MIVERNTWRAKPGRRDELVEWAKELIKWEGLTARVLTYEFGDYDTVILDTEWESMEDRQKWREGRDYSRPGFLEFVSRLQDLRESGADHKLLRVHE